MWLATKVPELAVSLMLNDDSADTWRAVESRRLFDRIWRARSGDLRRQRLGKLPGFWLLVREGYSLPIAYKKQDCLTGLVTAGSDRC